MLGETRETICWYITRNASFSPSTQHGKPVLYASSWGITFCALNLHKVFFWILETIRYPEEKHFHSSIHSLLYENDVRIAEDSRPYLLRLSFFVLFWNQLLLIIMVLASEKSFHSWSSLLETSVQDLRQLHFGSRWEVQGCEVSRCELSSAPEYLIFWRNTSPRADHASSGFWYKKWTGD